ncbi:tRNA (adenosine(37)-N6)-threonylcarbamoyltransferase complex ATPase subunit type 1 TsaE [Aciduricibacillus chroicocephali]|uniref:tRNA threonylcarbamoyladenosine biosynthesis protein TsaE n=1 Tax=Aciduricibacillus chroicocephali TaxID=3054939 RepID=A0ABY9KWK7_9BACI|nr:tRNA (adenosine(37)-N6)-threonylcarbamoyltransferase complex ATPase subunit type 1 TsaE [Bacillaceae bacterium 44XB]
MHQIRTESMEDTMRLGEKLALLLKKGDVITLEGELGAGKTTFTKGVARGLGIVQTLSSPTFTIIKEYKGDLPLYHMDAYRLEHSEEDLGFDEYFSGDGVSVVEWAQFIEEFLPKERLDVKIEYLNEHQRLFTLSPQGMHFEVVAAELQL